MCNNWTNVTNKPSIEHLHLDPENTHWADCSNKTTQHIYSSVNRFNFLRSATLGTVYQTIRSIAQIIRNTAKTITLEPLTNDNFGRQRRGCDAFSFCISRIFTALVTPVILLMISLYGILEPIGASKAYSEFENWQFGQNLNSDYFSGSTVARKLGFTPVALYHGSTLNLPYGTSVRED